MMRYFVRPAKSPPKVRQRADYDDGGWSEDIPRPSNLDVCDYEPVDTGLLDATGNEIWREPNPIGFIWEFSE